MVFSSAKIGSPTRAVLVVRSNSEAGVFEELLTAARFTQVSTWGHSLLGVAASTRSLYAANGDVVHFDLEGRWQRAKLAGRTYLRGLDGVVLERFGGPRGTDTRIALVGAIHQAVCEFVDAARDGAPVELPAWSVDALLHEAHRFLEAYRPVGIVPPDRYRSLILQATQGCSYNGCLFCSLYKGQQHRVVPTSEFRDHVRRVKAFIGSGLEERRGVFLGEANALAMPQPHLLNVFDVLHDELPQLALNVASFIDAFDVYRTAEEFRQVAARGLKRVFIGVESGDEATLAALGKPATVQGVLSLVKTLKAAGLSVGVIFLAGLGTPHVDRSAQLLTSLDLDERDVVYLSPLVVTEHSPLATQLARRGLARFDGEVEALAMRERMRGRAKIARYDVRRWVYS